MILLKPKKKLTLKRILKKVKIRHFIILAILLAANTYAWFIYVNTVSNSIDVHVKSWRIDFSDGNTPVTDYVNVSVDSVYPGMTTFTKTIDAYNYSEVAASVDFKIIEANIMGTQYVTVEGKTERGLPVLQTDLTSAQLVQKLTSDYPFTISFAISANSMVPETGHATFTVSIAWPFESGDDEEDTYWGNQAYQFKTTHPDDPCITLIAKVYISQAVSNNNGGGETPSNNEP